MFVEAMKDETIQFLKQKLVDQLINMNAKGMLQPSIHNENPNDHGFEDPFPSSTTPTFVTSHPEAAKASIPGQKFYSKSLVG